MLGFQTWSLVSQEIFIPSNQLIIARNNYFFFLIGTGNDCIHTCVVELPRKAKVESEVGDL